MQHQAWVDHEYNSEDYNTIWKIYKKHKNIDEFRGKKL